jgi:hypothetical protein
MKLTCLFDIIPLLLDFRIFCETLHLMVLIYILHHKGKLLTIVDPSARHFESEILPLKSFYSPKKFVSM